MQQSITAGGVACRLTIITPLPGHLGHIPFAPVIDFAALIRLAGAPGVFDPNSLEVIDLADGQPVPYARGDDFANADAGQIAWPIADPSHTAYSLRFRTVPRRPPLRPQPFTPLVGAGDLLRYNAGVPRPITLPYAMRLVDLTGDGRADLVGCWNYYHRPGAPVSGIVAYPRTDDGDFTFGDMARLRYRDPASGELCHFPGLYVTADLADLDGDGLPDIAFAEWEGREVRFFRNTGERDPGGWPIFAPAGAITVPLESLRDLQVVDLDGDGVPDLVAGGNFIRNANPGGWPFVAEEPVDLGIGANAAFFPDGALCLQENPDDPARFGSLCWRKRVGENPPAFGPAQPVATGGMHALTLARAAGERAVLIQHDAYQRIELCDILPGDPPSLARRATAGSLSAPLMLSDQAWPCACGWFGGAGPDLLVGGGYGRPQIVRNRGGAGRPAFDEAEPILAGGESLRLLRDEILGGHHWHNMGYPYPVLIDWDGDGLPDLLLPNETNRILWCRNTGELGAPRFAAPEYLEVDGFPDSGELRAASGKDAMDPGRPRHPYPADPRSPFDWRAGAAFADWNGDGLPDIITYDHRRQAALFVQYRGADGRTRLRREGPVRLTDGRILDDELIERETHWTVSFRAVDWEGDGLFDLIYSLAGTGAIYLLRNAGTPATPVFEAPRRLACYGEPLAFTLHGPHPWPADWNGDGFPDLLGCVEWSVYPFYAHAALEMPEHPRYEIGDVTAG